ncbi:hypothetical protein HER39_01860 [Arthrobacter deserti]|uniref:CDP-glycerol glycerophosphotransferase n=1 Tax=Arthrobacter deserti TaxID=1742687 RepID=A0ABX1JJ57_9MICC|nr:hypothetical protein [Arthrobacter deserti]
MALISADETESLPSAPRVLRGLIGDAGYGVGLTLLATAAVVVAASGGPAGLAAAMILVIGATGAVQTAVSRRRPAQALGHLTVPRATAFAAVSLLLVQVYPGPADRWTVALTAAAAIGMLLLEPLLRRAVGAQQAFAAHLPGVASGPAPAGHSSKYVTGSFVLLGLAAATAALGWPVWLWSVATAAVLGLYGATALNAYRRAAASRAIARDLGAAVRRYAPDFIIYTARPDDASYQVAMWLPYLQRTGRKFIIVTRSLVPSEALAAMTDTPVVMRRRVSDLDDVVVPSVNAIFYVNASSGNGAMVRFHALTHVYLGHGDSDKPPSYNPTHAMYDKIFAAGEAATRRYGEHGVPIPRDKFQVVGRPQLEDVQPARPAGAGDFPVVLYAPTWRGHVEETFFHSLPVGEKIVRSLLDRGATVIFRPHPFSYDFPEDAALIRNIQELLREDAQQTGRKHLWGAEAESVRGIIECMNDSDAMVSDVSSVVSDYLYSGKPFAMVAVNARPPDFVGQYPIARASYVLEGDLGNVEQVLDSLLGADEMAATRAGLRSDYLGDFPVEGYAEVFINAARTVASTGRRHGGPADDEVLEAAEPPAADDAPGDDGASQATAPRHRLPALLRFVLPAAGAAATWCTLLLGAPAALVCSAGLATVAVSLYFHRRALRRRRSLNAMLGDNLAARSLLVLALFLQLGTPGWAGAAIWLTAGLSCWAAATAVERYAVVAWRPRGLDARNIPGVNTQGHEILPRGSAAALSLAGLAAGFIAAYFGPAAAPAAAVLAVLVLAYAAKVLAAGWRRSYRNLRQEADLARTVEGLAPEFALYFGSNVGAGYQAGMWLPYLDRIGRPYIVITRTLKMMRAIAAITDAPVIHRPTLRSLEEVVPPSLKVAFYVNNAVKNTHFIERREMRHVWLNHGDSEKPACYNPVHAIYDHIFSAGQAGVDRYARHGVDIPLEKFRIVGRPQVEDIRRRQGPAAQNPTVLYAPTWRGPYADTAVYSLPHGRGIVEALLARGCTVIFRAHPFNYRFPEATAWIAEIGELLAADAAATGRQHVYGKAAEQEMSIVDCFNASDAMVADVSAVVSDYLQSGKPFSIVSVGRSIEELAAEAPASRAAYVIEEDLANLDQALDNLLVHDPLAAQREASRVYYLGDFPAGSYADGFLSAARELIDAPRRPL